MKKFCKPSIVVVTVISGEKSLFPRSFSARILILYVVNGVRFGTRTELDVDIDEDEGEEEEEGDPKEIELDEMNIVFPSIQFSVY